MIIKNGLVFEPDGSFCNRTIYTRDGVIVSHADADISDTEVIDASGHYVVPGFVDIHTHGAVGHDFCDADVEGLSEIARYEKSCGVTSFCPTSMTLPKDRLSDIFQTAKKIPNSPEYARIAGINMEGPFIADSKRGAQNREYIAEANTSMFQELNTLSGNLIRLVTLAPETPNAMEFIRALHDAVHISVGHSAADYDTASAAFRAGADHVTHLMNAMPPFHHRDPGIVGAAMDQDHVMVEVICDTIHIHPSMIRSIYRQFGPDRMILISDSMEATGMPDGVYSLGGQTVYKNGNHATLSDQTLAGSATNLFDCFLHAIQLGIPAESALRMVTVNPSRSIGMDKKIGTTAPGAYADLLLLDSDFHLVRVL